MRLAIRDLDSEEGCIVEVGKDGGFWYVGQFEFVNWLCDQMPEFRPADQELRGPIYRRKIHRRTGAPEKYLVSPIDYTCGGLPTTTSAVDSEEGTIRNGYTSDGTEKDGDAIGGVNAGSDDTPDSGNSVVGETDLSVSGQVDLRGVHVEKSSFISERQSADTAGRRHERP